MDIESHKNVISETTHPDVSLAFPNLGNVLEYLRDSGWKATKSSLYRHHGEGKLLPKNDGSYQLKDVEKYARTWLKQASTGKRVAEKTDELQRKKLERELANLDLKFERESFAHARDLGQYVPKEQMEIELAGRAGILDAGLKHWIQSRAADWIRAVDGDMKKVGELINIMSREADEHINTYATPKDYEIIIEADEETEGKGECNGSTAKVEDQG